MDNLRVNETPYAIANAWGHRRPKTTPSHTQFPARWTFRLSSS
jgi:hypothetical protein